ncbi:chromosome transmission fidelity protein 8 homolog [Chelonus insularis]|uniref:chromosome transmission fidelity protein 8 homolog n=1 Tax=Chelonus insularis TaxID=460826 RepID=UPI00158B50EF|nr:chromosome transmission fidelity protein 8 homolog [Chelonus insularis]
MFIPITKDKNLNEWAIIELQGDIQFDSSLQKSDQLLIGDLFYMKDCGTPVFIIGTHILHGKEITLSKPFAVLEKKKVAVDDNFVTEYTVKAIVKKKLIFKMRPKPIIREMPTSK